MTKTLPSENSPPDRFGKERLDFLYQMLHTHREQTEKHSTPTGVIENRYDRVLDGVEKVLRDYKQQIIMGNKFVQYEPIVLWALDILGVETDEWGWAPHQEYRNMMGW